MDEIKNTNEKPSVLAIDDETGLRDMLAFGLTKRGYHVVTASNGEEAFEKARRENFDLAVCDIMMPGKSGVEVLKTLKEIRPDTEVIMATGHATLETAVESMKLGAYDYITKPYGLAQLCAIFDKALERRRLKAQVGHLEELNRLKSEFLANMSHELRTPMNAILGYIFLLLKRVYGEIPQKQEDVLKRVHTNGKNLLQLINNILDLSKLAAGRMSLFIETCNLHELAKEVVETMESLANEKKLKLTWEAPGDLVIQSDKTKLKQILINLVGNGIKFTHEGGVSIKAQSLPEQSSVQILVQDTGIGIKEKDIPILFQEFKQLDASTTRKYGGTGLGLSICKKFLELVGGSIQVKSTPGAGSTFIVTIPATETKPPEKKVATLPKNLDIPKGQKVILGIDDDPDVLKLLSDSLQGSGYTFVGAQSGEEGIALARQLHPHLITLDIMMPHQDGWAVLQIIKNDPDLRSIPVFIVSVIENKALGFSLGVTDYIVKPFERHELLERLNLFEKGKSKKVLVADDDPAARNFFMDALSKEGYQVDIAVDGEEALAKITRLRPEVVFLDLVMPKLNGFEVLERINKDSSLKGTRVFVMTARNLTRQEAESLKEKVEIIIQKESRNPAQIFALLKEKLAAMKETTSR